MMIHTFVVLAYKESYYLEACIQSVLNQTYKTNVVIATSTPNAFIQGVADKYSLKVVVNEGEKGIGSDFDFAWRCVESELVTIAHQDDVYEPDYTKKMIEAYTEDTLILFCNYYEIRDDKKVYKNRNLRIKRVLLAPLKIRLFNKLVFIRRRSLSLGNPICCPSVTFSQKNISYERIFASDFKSNIDWVAWERISKLKGRFVYLPSALM